MGGWNPIDDIGDIIDDIVDGIVDIIEDVISWLIPMPEIPDFGTLRPDQNAKGILVNKVSANAHIPIIYGTRKVGGNIVFLETSGTDNEYLYMALVLSEGEIDEVTALYVNDKRVYFDGGALNDNVQRTVVSTDQNFYDTENSESLITAEAHFGSDTQTSSSLLSSSGIGEPTTSWQSIHKLQGLAYIALRFKWNADKFGSIPQVQALVKGRKIYDPRLDSTVTGGSGSHRKDDKSTWAYSDNPILQLLDYLRNDRFGMGITNSYFDSNFADWQTASNVCDTQVQPLGGDFFDIHPYGIGYDTAVSLNTISLMSSNTVVDTAKTAIDNVKDFVRGSRSFLNFSAGKYNILVETSGTASITLTEDNILGGITVLSKNKNSRFNRVIVNYIEPTKNYQSDSVQFPPAIENPELIATADQFETMKAEDGGILLEGRFDFSMMTNGFQAEEMAEIILRRSRSSLNISFKADATALDLAIGDIVNVTHATTGFSAKPFRVQGMTLNADHSISLTCSEHQDSYYSFGTKQTPDEIVDTTLPNPFIVQSPVLSVSDELRALNEEAISILIVNVQATDQFITDFEVQAKKTTDTNYINLGRGASSNFELPNVEDNAVYDVRARSVTSVSRSVFISAQHQVVGKTAPPADVTNFQVNIINTEAHLSWTPVPDLDLSHYIIRHSPLTTGATFTNAITLIDKVSRPANTITVPALTGTYFVRSVDKIGLKSLNATSNVALIENVKNLNFIASSTQNPTFTGAKSNVVVVDNSLILDTTINFEELTGNFDDAIGNFDGGGGNVASSGTYDFDTHIDAGGIYSSRITATVNMERLDYVNLFDDAQGLFDAREGVFDGGDTFGDVNVQLQIAKTDGDPVSGTYTNFQKFNVGDFKGRAFKFRAVLLSEDVEATPKVTGLSVTVDMPERVYSEKDIASGTDTNGKAITFTPAFKEISGVGISASNLASGDYYAITNKSATGFTIEFFNSSNATIDRTFDYVVRGYGELAS
jgi:hypothetical protein